MWCVCFLAIVTLVVLDDEFYNNRLLNGCTCVNFLLYRYFYLKYFGVRLCPKEGCIDKLNSFQSFDLLQTKGEKLWRFQLQMYPWWPQISIAFSAML